jgi:phosphotransferase system enzyme I (PtsI)
MARLELHGTAVSPGIGVGHVFVALAPSAHRVPQRFIEADDVDRSWRLLETARLAAIARLGEIQETTAKELGLQDAAIYAAQAAVLQDPEALRDLQRRVTEELQAPESAVQALLDHLSRTFEKMEGGDRKNWAADLRDPWELVLRHLHREDIELARQVGEGSLVIVAEELTPTLVVRYPREKVAALVCARGGRYSHGAVVARSYGIPTVTGVAEIDIKALAGEPVVVYGGQGRVLVGAEEEESQNALLRSAERAHVAVLLARQAEEPGRTADGTPVALLANIESLHDLDLFAPETVGGVGLFRTEFAYMERPSFPTMEEQVAVYERVLDRFPGKPVIFRTLDVGADKQLRYFRTPEEVNPALGWRGLRLSLDWQDLFLMQMQALHACRHQGQVHIMLPMVTSLDEVRRARTLLESVAGDDLEVKFGVMIEVPAAAMALADIVKEVDFISVGTNDLVQYLFAVDRDNPWVADLYQPYHPASLRVLRHIARTVREAGKPASVCGEMAGQPEGALFLAGCGFTSLSMAPLFVPETKALLRQVDMEALQAVVDRACAVSTEEEARGILHETAEAAWSQVLAQVKTTDSSSNAAS